MIRLLVAALPVLIAAPSIAQDTGGTTRPSWNAAQTKADAEQRAALIFGQLDRNQDGAITRDEIDTFTKAMGENPRMIGRVTKMFSESDVNQDGKVTAEEAKTRADTAFDAADADHDGVLTPEERQAARAAGGGAAPQQ